MAETASESRQQKTILAFMEYYIGEKPGKTFILAIMQWEMYIK